MWLPIFLLLVGTTLSSGQGCGNFQQIADGVHVIQPFGETQKKTIVQSSDCAAACMASTDFVCTAYLWAWPNGDCVLLDKIDLTRQVFKDRQNYRLYAEACDGATPSIGFCQFEITQQLAQASASSLSPGMTSPSGCHDFCVARYHNKNCTAFTVGPASTLYSTCTLFESITSADVSDGSMDLWTVVCHDAPVNCVYGAWTEWSESTCSVSCGGGTQTRTRPIETEGSEGGVMCSDEETTSTQECNTEVCSMDCTYSDWSAYDTCSVTCGSGGTQTRTRTIESEPTGAGLACDESTLTESQPCSASVDCPVDCVYSEWSDFGDCSVSCGEGGEQSRTRTITTEAEGDGTPCDPSSLTETQTCAADGCPTNCMYAMWGSWGMCSATCGGGTQTRSRSIGSEATNGGVPCDTTLLSETQECVMDGCPVDCIYGMWGDWGTCSVTCDSGDQERTREVASEGADGGEECNPTMLSETQSCDAGVPCETGDCVYGDWSDFGSCSSSCTGGEMTRYRDVVTEGTFGIPCTEEDKMETMSCNDDVECSESCEIKNVDPQSKPSSKGYKAVGKVDDCGATCAAETSFVCEAYLTKGPGDQCILYGKIDQHTTVLPMSVWTMYDLKCAVNKTANTSICMWKIVKTNIDPAATANGSGKGLFQAVDATHCQQLCQNNFPMNHCKAFAFSPNVPFYTTQSCYMYGEIDDVSSVPTNSSSTYDLYMLSC